MKYLVRHRSAYAYSQPVVTSFHRLHLAPMSGHGQEVLDQRIVVEHPTEEIAAVDIGTVEHIDQFGNHCTRIELLRPYTELAVTGWSRLAVERIPPTSGSLPWDHPHGHLDPAIDEFRFDSLHIRRHGDLAAYAQAFFTAGTPLLDCLMAFTSHIYNDCTYDPQATDIATPPREILRTRRGVCQDFAHLGIACLRSLGLPTAYVSGYLETEPPAGQARLVGADASHAWFAVWDPQLGWLHADPTNGCLIGNRHVITALGRDFADVSPVIGIIYGGGTQQLSIAVDVVPEPEWDAHPLHAAWPA